MSHVNEILTKGGGGGGGGGGVGGGVGGFDLPQLQIPSRSVQEFYFILIINIKIPQNYDVNFIIQNHVITHRVNDKSAGKKSERHLIYFI